MKKIALREKSFARQKDYSFTAKAEETRCTSENKRGLKKCIQKKKKKNVYVYKLKTSLSDILMHLNTSKMSVQHEINI